MFALLAVLVTIVLVLNTCATFVATRSLLYDKKQKCLQYLLIWLLPIFGSLLVWFFAHETKPRKISSSTNNQNRFDDGNDRLDNYSGDIFVGDNGSESGDGGH